MHQRLAPFIPLRTAGEWGQHIDRDKLADVIDSIVAPDDLTTEHIELMMRAADAVLAALTDEVETAWRAYHAVADEVERLRALTTVDDATVERAARAVYGVAFAAATVGWGMANQSMRDTCRTLSNAALNAALGVES